MGRRLSVLIRGPGVLAISIAVVAIIAASNRPATASPGRGSRATSSPVVVGEPTTTPHPRFGYRLSASGAGSLLDSATHTLASVSAMQVQPVVAKTGNSPSILAIILQVTVENRGRRTARVSPGDFFLLAQSGETYGSLAPASTYRFLAAGPLGRGRRAAGWIQFDIPARKVRLTLYWTDDNHLLPPVAFRRIDVKRIAGG